jgi:uncharacterized membrane protein AbrB (regulator of aidB expression)
MRSKSLWPIVAMVGVLVGGIVVMLTVTPDSNAAARDAAVMLLSMLGPLLTGVWVTRHAEVKSEEVKESVAQVKDQVNGRMSELIAKVPDAVPQEGATDEHD